MLTPTTVVSITYVHRNFIYVVLAYPLGSLIHRTTASLKSCSFLQSSFCYFIGSISIVLEYLPGKVPSAQPGRRNNFHPP